MDSRWRGANGEVGGEAGDEYALCCNFSRELRRYRGRKGGIVGSCPRVLQSLTVDIEKRKVIETSLTLQIYRKFSLQLQDEDGRRLGAN